MALGENDSPVLGHGGVLFCMMQFSILSDKQALVEVCLKECLIECPCVVSLSFLDVHTMCISMICQINISPRLLFLPFLSTAEEVVEAGAAQVNLEEPPDISIIL